MKLLSPSSSPFPVRSFPLLISIGTDGSSTSILTKEPFVYSMKSKNLELKLELEFMGHYLEPNLTFVHKPSKPTDCKMYSLEYNAFTRSWKVDVQDAKPIEFTYLRILNILWCWNDKIIKMSTHFNYFIVFNTKATHCFPIIIFFVLIGEDLEEEKKLEKEEEGVNTKPGIPKPADLSNMFVVEPIDNCPHLHDSFKEDKIPIGMLATGIMDLPCKACGDKSENWLCLECYQIGCSRYVNCHQEAHFKETGHCIAVSFSDLSVWCYQCESYIRNYVRWRIQMRFLRVVVVETTVEDSERHQVWRC